ncbi:MAG: Sjogren's syndrome/scleroderma autoantigen 1 family protein [Promethearchaeota archaeon]
MTDDRVTKRMGKLLRQGAALLDKACPKCNTPLLKMTDGTMYCANCDKRVVEEGAIKGKEKTIAPKSDVLTQLASHILLSLDVLCKTLPEKSHLEEIRKFAEVTEKLVKTLHMIRDLQS